MIVWIDAQISPALARWLADRFGVEDRHVKDLDLVEATDASIFDAARLGGATVLTKDHDFVDLVRRCGAPPHIIWVTSGNTSNCEMMRILEATFELACRLLAAGEPVVEVKG